MERLYNPDLMSEAEIKQTFVARQSVVDDLLGLVRNQGQGAGVQHAVIVAPRGMGKTTILLMVQFGLTDTGLAEEWEAIRFPEESYAINDLADFWLETLRNLAVAVEEPELAEKADALLDRFPETKDLQEAAYAVLVQWSKTHKKRLLLLVDNFDQILEQISSELDNASLRNVLMNDGTVMLIGGATTIFHQARAYDQPLYNFFKIFNLPELSFSGVQDLLRRRADADGEENFEETLQDNTKRLQVLRYFTGGNPRLVLMLYRVIAQSEITEVRESLEKLLDEVTPYYKAKIEALAPQLRKILDHIARVSSQTSDGLTPSEVAREIRVSPQAASKQLNRLRELGYVRAANTRGRNSFYTLSEPLYAIWHQMRFGRGSKRRIQWLISSLKGWYGDEGLGNESQRLARIFSEFCQNGLKHEALKTLEYRWLIAHAVTDDEAKEQMFEGLIKDCLKIDDMTLLKEEIIPFIKVYNLPSELIEELYQRGCIDIDKLEVSERDERALEYVYLGLNDIAEEHWQSALENIQIGLRYAYNPRLKATSLNLLCMCLTSLDQYEDAIVTCDQSLEINSRQPSTWVLKGDAYNNTGQFSKALECYDRAIEMRPNEAASWMRKAALFTEIGNSKEAYQSAERAKNIWLSETASPEDRNRGLTLDFYHNMNENNLPAALSAWNQIDVSIESNDVQTARIDFVVDHARSGHARHVLQFITETKTEEIFLPLYRALAFLTTGDDIFIEKLSPEIRNLVLDMVTELEPQFADVSKPLPKKPKAAPRKRINKQLN